MILKKENLSNSAAVLFKIDNEAFIGSFALPSRDTEELVEYLKNSEVFIAYEKNKPIGFIAYESNANMAEIKSVAVIPKYQGKGFGKKMVKSILEMIDTPRIVLVTHPKNSAAVAVYLKCGFNIVGWKDNYYGDGEPRLLLELQK